MAKVAIVDFDGTIVKHSFPKVGEPKPHAFEVLKELKAAGWKLILFTCREDEGYCDGGININKQYLTDAVKFCKENGVEFDAVNESFRDEDFRSDKMCKTRKPYGHVHIDDRNLGGFIDWEVVRAVLLGGKKLRWELVPDEALLI